MKSLLLAACMACSFAGGVAAADDKATPITPGSPAELDGLLAYWKLDEGDGTTAEDVSPNKMKATLHGGRWAPGAKGTALQFDKDGDYLDYGDSPQLNFKAGAAFTFAGWVKTMAERGAVVSQRNSKDGGANIDLTLNGGKVTALVRSDNKETGQHATVTSGAPINDGEWHHFALTRDTGRTIELFIDGVSQGQASGADAGGAVTTNLRALGSERSWVRTGFPGAQFVGAVDEFCVFGRALNPEEIRKLAGPPRPVAARKEPPPGAARYAANGVTFDYPKAWMVMADKPGGVVSVAVQNDKGTQALVQVHPADADPKAVRSQLESVMRKAFEGKLVAGSEKAAKRKIAGADREGAGMDFEAAKDVPIHFEFFAFPLAAKKPVVVVVFQNGSFDSDAAKEGFDLIAASLAASPTEGDK
ncbi:MAG TPA: LamG domain-containing protein [Gemmataceae bacterium]|nr:LamG domain-containing protein [Gemmataceae bacterium]